MKTKPDGSTFMHKNKQWCAETRWRRWWTESVPENPSHQRREKKKKCLRPSPPFLACYFISRTLPRNLFDCSLFSSSSSKLPSPYLTVPPILVAAGAYLPGQAITCFPVSVVSSMASFISSMASLVAGPTHGERSPLLLSGAASSSNIYKKTKYPLALQRGSTHSILEYNWLFVVGLNAPKSYTM